ncbi:SLAM family member 5-like, partial [Silurus asotus]
NCLNGAILLLPAVWSEDVKKATAYTGEQVVLKLNVNPSWKLSVIQWSIYKTFTFIATFFENNVYILDNFKDRLKLNTTSGDLTIKNVTAKDALKFTVYLETITGNLTTIVVQLFVQDRVHKPNITLLHSFLDAEKCVISLKCSSLSSNISLRWKLEPGLTEHFCSDSPAVTRESVMWTSLRTNRVVNFTCIATDGTHNESKEWSGKCQ